MHNGARLRLGPIDLAMDRRLIRRGVLISDVRAFAIEVGTSDVVHAGESDALFLASSAT
jgi:hypothetical protein